MAQLGSVAEQASLSLTWSQICSDRFSHDMAQEQMGTRVDWRGRREVRELRA